MFLVVLTINIFILMLQRNLDDRGISGVRLSGIIVKKILAKTVE